MAKILRWFERIPGLGYLMVAVVIFAAANAVTRKLTEIGAQNLIDGRNPISFCNVLFVGNLVALATLLLVYRQAISPRQWRGFTWQTWLSLTAIALLSGALAPALFFIALDQTAVNNVVLIGRLEPPLTLALSVSLLGERVNRWVVAGAALSLLGVMLTIGLQVPETPMVAMGLMTSGRGELLAVGGAVAAAIATIISKTSLEQVPLGLFNIFRTALGTAIFFVTVIILFEPDHFQDAFSPFVWQWMLVYGVVIVAGGQLAWFQGLKSSPAAEVSLASSFNPIAGLLAALLILGEAPTMAHYIGGAVIFVGIALNHWGVTRRPTQPIRSTAQEQTLENSMGFRGV
jgi:drug/metabolite transporter (DMT)-like permease